MRFATWPAALAVVIMRGFCGWALAVPAVVAPAAGCRERMATPPAGLRTRQVCPH